MDNKAATLLQKYVNQPDTKRSYFNPVENAYGSGPGGASATARLVSRKMNATSSPSEKDQIAGDALSGKLNRSIAQMKQVRDIYNQATNKLKKKKFPVTSSPHGNFNPEDQGI